MAHAVQGYGTRFARIWHMLCMDMAHALQGYGTRCAGIWHTLCRDMAHAVHGQFVEEGQTTKLFPGEGLNSVPMLGSSS